MEYLLVIPGRLSNLNDYTYAERSGKWHKGAKMKSGNEKIVSAAIEKCFKNIKISNPIEMHTVWHEKNRRRDPDNIAFAKKFILDALVKAGVLADDGWDEIVGFSDRFKVDKKNPHVEVLIKEVGE